MVERWWRGRPLDQKALCMCRGGGAVEKHPPPPHDRPICEGRLGLGGHVPGWEGGEHDPGPCGPPPPDRGWGVRPTSPANSRGHIGGCPQTRAVLWDRDFFFCVKDRPKGPSTASHQPPPTANRQPPAATPAVRTHVRNWGGYSRSDAPRLCPLRAGGGGGSGRRACAARCMAQAQEDWQPHSPGGQRSTQADIPLPCPRCCCARACADERGRLLKWC